jgi:hypothetical protein
MATQSVPTFSEFRIRASTVRLLSGVIAGLLFSAPAFNACAIGLPVTSCADDGSADTLRSAVASAQDGDVVTLNQLPLVCSTVSLSTGALEIPVANLTIEGDVNRSITISAAGKSRVLHHTGTGTLVLKYLGVTDGYYIAPVAHGGCIYSAGSVTLFADDEIYNCAALGGTSEDHYSGDGKGGAIFAQGSVAVQDSLVSQGFAGGSSQTPTNQPLGGNIYAGGAITVTHSEVSYGHVLDEYFHGEGGGLASMSAIGVSLTRSLIVGNEADYGGGIFIHSADATVQSKISDSTFANNVARYTGGGVYVGTGALTLENSTIGYNYPDGVAAYSSTMTLHSTVAFGSPAYDVRKNSASSITLDHNVIGKTNFLIIGSDTLRSDPHLGPLQRNGGRFRSVALLPGSPAIDAGSNPDNLIYDQRGAPRAIGPAPDIGSFEFDPDVIFTSGFE